MDSVGAGGWGADTEWKKEVMLRWAVGQGRGLGLGFEALGRRVLEGGPSPISLHEYPLERTRELGWLGHLSLRRGTLRAMGRRGGMGVLIIFVMVF